MKRNLFTEEQIIRVVRECEGGAAGLHAALSAGSAFRPVAQPAREGMKTAEALIATA
jgi:hypothetical protein